MGSKAVQTPRGFSLQNNKKQEENEQEFSSYDDNNEKPENEFKYQSNGGVEFRAKLSTAIGVDQPKLTQFYQEVQSTELDLPKYDVDTQASGPAKENVDFPTNPQIKGNNDELINTRSEYQEPNREKGNGNSQDYSSSHIVPEYQPENDGTYREEPNPNFGQNFRPNQDFSNYRDAPLPPPPPPPQLIQGNRNPDQVFRGRQNVPSLINQQQPQINHFNSDNSEIYSAQTFPQQNPESQPQQISPLSFYSENPKFKTTVKIPSQFSYNKPIEQSNGFNPSIQIPIQQQTNLRQNNQGRQPDHVVQDHNIRHVNLKFPNQNDNLDNSDEYDVSLNDALQPISTLHPRNVATGIYLSNLPRNQQQQQQSSSGFRRRTHNGNPRRGEVEEQKEYNSRRFDSTQRNVQESRNVPNHSKRFVMHREAASNIQPRFVISPLNDRPIPVPGKFLAVLMQ